MKPALPLQQSRSFGAALALMGRDVCYLPTGSAAPVLALRQWGQYLASRAPVLHGPLAQLRVLNADTASQKMLKAAGFYQIMTPAHIAEMDLCISAQARQTRMKPKWRNVWRRAQDMPLTITQEVFDAHKHVWLLAADRAQQRRKRFRGLPHQLITAYAANAPKAVAVYVARVADTPVAAMLFLRHAPVATYHLGWTNDIGRRCGAHHRIIMNAADRFAAEGFCRLDLGTVDTESAPGLARFKIGTGANVRPLGGTWLRLYRR